MCINVCDMQNECCAASFKYVTGIDQYIPHNSRSMSLLQEHWTHNNVLRYTALELSNAARCAYTLLSGREGIWFIATWFSLTSCCCCGWDLIKKVRYCRCGSRRGTAKFAITWGGRCGSGILPGSGGGRCSRWCSSGGRSPITWTRRQSWMLDAAPNILFHNKCTFHIRFRTISRSCTFKCFTHLRWFVKHYYRITWFTVLWKLNCIYSNMIIN